MKIAIITGATTFTGCHIADRLNTAGLSVIATHNREMASYEGDEKLRLDWLKSRNSITRWHRLDLADTQATDRLIATEKPSVWIHHAGVSKGYGTPVYDLAQGFKVCLFPLESIYRSMAEHGDSPGIIITGSSAEYGVSDCKHDESECARPNDPYGLTKLTATLYSEQLANRYGIPTRVARIFMPIGPFESSSRLVPLVLKALKKNEVLRLSACEQIRDYIHVQDLAHGYERLLNDMEARSQTRFEIFNICSGEPLRVRDLLTRITESIRADLSLLQFGTIPKRPLEPEVLIGDNSKARMKLGWSPTPLTSYTDVLGFET